MVLQIMSKLTWQNAKKSENMKNYLRYFYAILAVPIIILIRFALLPLTGHGTPFITLFPATVIIALLGGMGPAVLTGVLGVLITDYFFIPPLHSWNIGIEFWSRTTVVILTSTFVGYVGTVLRQARTSAEEQAVELSRSREDLKRAQTVANTGSWRLDIRNNKLIWSDEAYSIFGVSNKTELTYESFLSYIHPDDRQYVEQKWEAALKGGKYDIEHRIVVEGQIKWVRERAELEYEKDGALSGGFGTVTDITERKKREETLYRLNRTLRALSDSTQAMAHAKDELEYIQEVCDIIVKDCGYTMVWIGFAENDQAKSVRPVAYSGFEKGYIDTLKITWADAERGRGPTGTAIRTGKTCFCRNMLTDHAFEPWRAEALERGYASSISIPLMSGRAAFGALTIYSTESDPFSQDEVNLLAELVSDLSFGITSIRLRITRDEAEDALRESERKYRELVQNANSAIIQWNRGGKITLFNEYAQRFFGYLADEVLGGPVDILLPQGQSEEADPAELIRGIVNEPQRYANNINENVCKNGHRVWMAWTNKPIYDENGQVSEILAIGTDITKQKKAEESLQKARDELETRVKERTAELNETVSQLQEQMVSRIKAEETAIAERQRFNDVLETLPAYICLLTPDYYMPFANRVFRELFGYYPDKKCYEFLFDRSKPCENCKTYKVFETNKPQHWEWTGPNGRDYDIYDFPFKDTDGSRLILEMGIDVTEQKQAEKRILDDQEQLRALTTELLMVGENERRKIATELHDSVGQILAFLKIELGDLQRSGLSKESVNTIRHLREQVEQAIKQTRTLTFEMSPPELYTLGLGSALEELAHRFSEERYLTCSVDVCDSSYLLSEQMKILLYRSVRELLVNVAKHAQAKSVKIIMRRVDNDIEIIVEDNGVGFDASRLNRTKFTQSPGFGLFSIRERLRQMGGKLEIDSGKGKGTKITFLAPLEQKVL
jgi:PAS domain S-box-containing protein